MTKRLSIGMRLTLSGVLGAAVGLAGYLAMASLSAGSPPPADAEAALHKANIVVGPFDIHRKYRSMEGPFVIEEFKVADMLASPQIVVPESTIRFVETNHGQGPAMKGGKAAGNLEGVEGLKDTSAQKRELLWFKGIKLQVLDENDKPLPTAEFICHLNLDCDPKQRHELFPNQETSTERLITLTQGQTEFHFPEGFAVPVASDETWKFYFQAANRTTKAHRRIKHLCTLEFEKDSELQKRVQPLCWYDPFVQVVIDKNSPVQAVPQHEGMSCMVIPTMGANAPNMVNHADFKNYKGVNVTGHFVVPQGLHTFVSEVNDKTDPGLTSEDRMIRAVWSHVHPLCTEASVLVCTPEGKKPIFTAHVQTKTDSGLEIAHIDNIYSKEGIPLPGNQHYEVSATYNNTTDHPEDSMVVEGIFCDDMKWQKPNWDAPVAVAAATADPGVVTVGGGSSCSSDGVDCGVKPSASNTQKLADTQTPPYFGVDKLPLYNPQKDGPILSEPKTVTVKTSAGPLHLVLDPTLAPQTASQIYKLLKQGAFDKTFFYRYDKDFVLQLTNAEEKVDHSTFPPKFQSELRRLPLEISVRKDGYHHKWALSMGRYDPPDSSVTSFSILLGDAPHLDHGYTIFGHMVADQASVATVQKILSHWSPTDHPYIESVSEDSKPAIASAVH